MKSAGLSSTYRNQLKKVTKHSVYASQQESYLAAKEKQKSLRLQAAKAEADRRERAFQSPVADSSGQTQ